MPRYIGIQHSWFIDSKGWDIIHLDSTNYEDALKEAALLQVDLMSSFNHCAIKVIEIGTDEHIVRRDNRKEWLIKWETYQKAVIDKRNCEEDFDH